MDALDITAVRRELREIRDRLLVLEARVAAADLPGRDGGALDAHISTAVDSLAGAYGAALDIKMARRVADLGGTHVVVGDDSIAFHDRAVAQDGRA